MSPYRQQPPKERFFQSRFVGFDPCFVADPERLLRSIWCTLAKVYPANRLRVESTDSARHFMECRMGVTIFWEVPPEVPS